MQQGPSAPNVNVGGALQSSRMLHHVCIGHEEVGTFVSLSSRHTLDQPGKGTAPCRQSAAVRQRDV